MDVDDAFLQRLLDDPKVIEFARTILPHSEGSEIFLSVARSRLKKSHESQSLADLNMVIMLYDDLAVSMSSNHPDRARRLNNSSVAVSRRFERTGSMNDLDRAIAMNQETIALTPEDYPNHGIYLNNLGIAL